MAVLICTLGITAVVPGASAQVDSSDLGDAHGNIITDTAKDVKSAYNDAADAALGDTRDEVETGALALGACAATSGGCVLIGGTYVAKHAIDDDSELS